MHHGIAAIAPIGSVHRTPAILVASNEFINFEIKTNNMCKRYIYARVSTQEQNFDQQLHEIKLYGINIDEVDDIISEHESGGTSYTDRKLQSLLNRCKPGDEIFVASTDRLGRDFFDMIHLMEEAKKRGVIITACKQRLNLDDENPMSQMFLLFTTMFDQDERKRISRRTANKKAWQREQIAKHGYFIIENGPNKGEKCTYVGSQKGHDTSKAREASMLAKQDAAIAWREQSQAVRYALRKRAEGWTLQRIVDEIGQLYDDNTPSDPKKPNPYATPNGCKPSKGTISKWLREANPLTLAV